MYIEIFFAFSLIVSDAHINHLEMLSCCYSNRSTYSTLMFPHKSAQSLIKTPVGRRMECVSLNDPTEGEWQHKEGILF